MLSIWGIANFFPFWMISKGNGSPGSKVISRALRKSGGTSWISAWWEPIILWPTISGPSVSMLYVCKALRWKPPSSLLLVVHTALQLCCKHQCSGYLPSPPLLLGHTQLVDASLARDLHKPASRCKWTIGTTLIGPFYVLYAVVYIGFLVNLAHECKAGCPCPADTKPQSSSPGMVQHSHFLVPPQALVKNLTGHAGALPMKLELPSFPVGLSHEGSLKRHRGASVS